MRGSMKVLYVLKTNTGAGWAFNQAKWLHTHGVEIVAVLPNDTDGFAENYKKEGMKVIGVDFSLPVTRPWFFQKRKKLIAQIISQEQPDIIHSHFVTTTMMLRLALKKSVIPRLFQVPGPLHLENALYRKAEINLANQYDYWAGSCQKTERIYLESGIEKSKVFLAYYGGLFAGEENAYREPTGKLRGEYGIPEEIPIVATVSYFYKPKWYMLQKRGLKGHEDFIDAIKILKEQGVKCQGVIIGGPADKSKKYEKRLRNYAGKKCGDSIVFTGFKTNMKDIYRELDVAVHPSLSENLGGAGESLAAGVPTITTDIGGFPDIIQDGKTGFLVPVKRPDKIAEAVARVLGDKKEAQKIARCGQRLSKEKFDIQATAKRVLEIYHEILHGGNDS